MLEAMPSSGLTRWRAYSELDPFGEQRADLRAGIIASTVANVHRDPAVRPQPWKPSDFMPDFDGSWRRRQFAALGQRIREIFKAFPQRPKEPRP